MTVKRTTQVHVDVVNVATPAARVTRVGADVLSMNDLSLLITKVGIDVISTNVPDDVGGVQLSQLITAT